MRRRLVRHMIKVYSLIEVIKLMDQFKEVGSHQFMALLQQVARAQSFKHFGYFAGTQ